jgi:signal peptidase I
VAVLAWVIRSLIFAPFSIPSGSMLPTLHIGDYVLVAKWPYGYSRYSFPLQFPPISGRIPSGMPDRGDVAVFVPPDNDGEDLIKRVIAVAGDTVEVREGIVILNGKPLRRSARSPIPIPISPNSPCRTVGGNAAVVQQAGSERSCVYSSYDEQLPSGPSYRVIDQVDNGLGDNFPATQVPSGHVFLMGDNRDDSLDSRFSAAEGGIGMVPVDHLVGRATVLFWSTDGSASYFKPWTWFSALRFGRLGKTFGGGS